MIDLAASETPRSVRFKGENLAIPDAFWDAEADAPNLGALVKSHSDLRRKLSEVRPEPPETYEIGLPEALAQRIRADAEDPLAKGAMDWARRNGLGQEAFSELAGLYFGRLAEVAVDPEAEEGKLRAALGDRAETEIAGLGRWIDGLLGDVIAESADLHAALDRLTATADGVMLMKAIRDKLGEAAVPSSRAAAPKGADAQALRTLQGSEAYLSGDPETRRRVAEGWARLFPGQAG